MAGWVAGWVSWCVAGWMGGWVSEWAGGFQIRARRLLHAAFVSTAARQLPDTCAVACNCRRARRRCIRLLPSGQRH